METTEHIDPSTGEIFLTKTPEPAQGPLSPMAGPWSGARRPHPRVQYHPVGPSLTKQSFANECNINHIMKKFQKSGLVDHLNENKGEYGNYIGYEDYHTSMNKILAADIAFSSIPSSIRANFNNDPAKFLEFAQNPENLDELIEMGLAPPKVPRDRYAPKEGQGPEKPSKDPEPSEKGKKQGSEENESPE